MPKRSFHLLFYEQGLGDRPNSFDYEKKTRFEPKKDEFFLPGVETLSIDQCPLTFGANKLAADILVQEYGKYFGLKTVVLEVAA